MPISYVTDTYDPSEDPTQHLFIAYTDYAPEVITWVTRGRFAPPDYALSLIPNENIPDITPASSAIPHCRLLSESDKYYINFMRTTKDIPDYQRDLPYFLRADLESRSLNFPDSKILTIESGNVTLAAYNTYRITFDQLSLDSSSIIYLRLPDISFGKIASATVLKGTVSDSTDVLYVPSDPGSSCSSCSDATLGPNEAVWLDYCWHCAAIDHISVDITAGDAYLQHTSVEYSITNEVTTWTDITRISADFSIEGNTRGYAFFTASLPSDTAVKITAQVTAGAFVTVDLLPVDCSQRSQKRSIQCPRGYYCEVYTSQSNTKDLVGDYRIVITGEGVKGTISAYTNEQVCTSAIDGNIAPFCGRYGYSPIGDAITVTQKDNYAEYFYNQLLTDFNGALTGACTSPRTEDENLRAFACQYALPRCSAGFGLQPDYDTCRAVEDSWGITFVDAGHPELSCNHNFFNGGVTWVGPGDDDNPVIPPSDNTGGAGNPNLLWLLFLLLIPFIIIIVAIVKFCAGSDGGDYSTQLTN